MKNKNNKFWIIFAILIFAILFILVIKNNMTIPDPIINNDLEKAPTTSDIVINMKAARLQKLPQEGSVTHNHGHIDLIINGESIDIPEGIGIGSNFISPIHTHDEANILHVESPYRKNYTLGQFFTEWGVTLDNNCVANYCTDDNNKLLVYTNGKQITDPEKYILKQYDEIEIWYGNKNDTPEVISSFDFPSDL